MPQSKEREYVLGTHDEEIARLGLQHRVWRSRVLEAWDKAGISAGSRVLDVGAGPGYATVDLAEIAGPGGRVVGIERSARFLEHARSVCSARGLTNVELQEADLMSTEVYASGMDAAWCRWVASFVSSPEKLTGAIVRSLRRGGTAIIHEYADYRTWRLAPRRVAFESFVDETMKSWRATGGEPDIALVLPSMLEAAGCRIRRLVPHIMTVRPGDFVWQWPAAFVATGVQRLLDLGRVDAAWVAAVRKEFREAEADPSTMMITPLVLEIIAERL